VTPRLQLEEAMDEANHLEPERRRGSRLVMQVPLSIRGKTRDGRVLSEHTLTEVIGAQGAMIRTSQLLQMGSDLEVTNRLSEQTLRFRVVWAGENQKEGQWEIGIEAAGMPEGFWGVLLPAGSNP